MQRFEINQMIFKNDKNIKIPKSKQIILGLTIWLALTLVTGSIIYYIYNIQKNAYISKLQSQQEFELESAKSAVLSELKNVNSDLMFLSESYLLQNFFAAKNITPLQKNFLTFAREKKIYDQIRFLDLNGLEIVRINYNNGLPMIIPDNELQNKSERYYFNDTIELEKGKIYLSPLDLNIEGAQIERPFKPMLRVGTPVYDPVYQKKGIVILNYKAQDLLDQVKKHLMLINKNGYWLKCDNEQDCWGFMLGHNRSFAASYPDVWEFMKNNVSGKFFSNNILFTFETIFPLKEGMRSSSGAATAFESSKNNIENEQYYWKLLSLVPNPEQAAGILKLRKEFGLLAVIFIVFYLLISFILARMLIYRNMAEKKLRRTAKELKQNNKTKDKLFSIIAHDLRNPVGGINNALALLTDDNYNLEINQNRELIAELKKASESTYNLLENLLLWASYQKDDIKTLPLNFSVKEIIDSNIHLLSPMANNKSIRLDTEISDGLVAFADQDMIKTVLRNLMTNAIKFTPVNGNIKVTAVQNENLIEFSVIDNGMGIAEDNLNKLFKNLEFFSTSGTQNEKGSGLGLDISKRFVNLHGGKIWIKSKIGEGSTFTFTVPAGKIETLQ